jgi:S-adenosylmethionine:tRNA ribosyltransferase-isomerase
MDRREFHYDLPTELIAQAPLPARAASRLLVLDGVTGAIDDRQFADLGGLLRPGDLLVLNDTRVLPARLFGRKQSGGRVELLLDRITGSHSGRFQSRAHRSPKPGTRLVLDDGAEARVVGRDGDLFDVELDTELAAYLEQHGEVPLPPYIDRPADDRDADRYQTVYAKRPGAVAAPTAGLHFDESSLDELTASGIEHAFLTLHVGAGTFAPVRTERIEAHRLHAERIHVPQALCERIVATRARGGRTVAIGTTTVRALESTALDREFAELQGETSLFIRPGFRFRIVDAIVTNFHLPESSLLMLVAAFAGHGATMAAYRHAVAERYRFFSYGDAMLVLPAGDQVDAVRA